MKKKLLNSMRVLLVAALLGGASSAWADATLVYGRALTASGDYAAWDAEGDIQAGEWVASKGTASLDENRGLKVAQQRGSALASKTISVTENAILTIDAEWDTGYSLGGNGDNNAFVIGNNIEVRAYGQAQKGCVYINGAEYATVSNACSKNNGNRGDDLWTIHMVINTASNTITALTIDGRDGTKKASYALDGTINLDATSTYNSISLAHNRASGNNASEATYLKSILITEEAQVVSNVDYTVKFQDTAGNTLKDDVTYTNGAVVGALFTATSTDMATFYNDGNTKKYVYKSGQNTSTMATATASDNVITLVFDTYEKFTYSLKYKLGTADAVEQATADIWEDETATIYYPVCRQDESNNYYIVSKNESEPYFGKVMSSTNADITINYTLDEDIVYYKESENMAGSRYNYAQVAAKTSNGSSYCAAASNGSYIATDWSVAAGYYNIEVAIAGRKSSSPTPKLMTSAEDASPAELASIAVAESGLNIKTYYNQEIAAGQNLYIFNDNGNNASLWALDYVILRKLPTSIEVNMSDAGWATLYTPYALDFTTQPGITAYTAAVADGKVTLTKVDNVPANTGVVLKGDGPSFYQINVAASSETAKGDLLGSATDATAFDAYADNTLYMLKKVGEKAQFVPVTGGEIAAGKAYLKVTNATTARNLDVTFADEATGIESVKSEEIKVKSEVYNLKGQRVSEPTKGLYIVNGKKIAIK